MKKQLPLVIGIAAFVVVMLCLFVFDFSTLSALVQNKSNVANPGKTKGNPNATVEFIELSDFQ